MFVYKTDIGSLVLLQPHRFAHFGRLPELLLDAKKASYGVVCQRAQQVVAVLPVRVSTDALTHTLRPLYTGEVAVSAREASDYCTSRQCHTEMLQLVLQELGGASAAVKVPLGAPAAAERELYEDLLFVAQTRTDTHVVLGYTPVPA